VHAQEQSSGVENTFIVLGLLHQDLSC